MVVSTAACRRASVRGLTLIELLVATAIGALLLAGLTSVARLALQARSEIRDSTEAVYQARFALERVALAAKASAPKSLLVPAAKTSGDWFSPVYFCVNTAAALIETTSTDTGCSGTQVIAERVSSFSASLPAGASALDAATAIISISTAGPDGNGTVTLVEQMRLGGSEL